jgi:hypothetical protein
MFASNHTPNRPRSARRLLLQFCGLAAAASGLNAAPFFGLDHAPLGGATLGMTPDDRLVISNLGSSGNDGVSIDAGLTRGIALDLDFGPRGSLGPDFDLSVFVFEPEPLRACNLRISGTGDGKAAIGLHSDGKAPSSVTVTLIENGQIVETAQHQGTIPAVLLDGDFGTAPGENGLGFEFVQSDWGYSWTITAKSTPLLINADGTNATPPRSARRVIISIHGLPPGEPVTDRVRVQGANLPGGTLAIAGESIPLPMAYADEDGFGDLHFSAAALGSVTLGSGDPCAGCLECCENMIASLDAPTAWRVEKLGSSGEDGVEIRTAGRGIGESGPGVPGVSFLTSPIDLADIGDTLRFQATGRLADAPGSPLGFITLTNAGPVLLDADYSAVGSDQVRIVVYNHGVPAGFVDVVGGTGVPVAEILPTGPSVRVSKCGKRGGIGQPPCFVMCTPEPVLVIAGGQVMFGDNIRVLAMNASGSVDALESFGITGAGLEAFTVAPYRDPDSGGAGAEIAVAGGIRVAAIGDAGVTPTPDGGLVISRSVGGGIGSVGFDMGTGEGLQLELGGGHTIDLGEHFSFGFRENDGVAGGDIYRQGWTNENGVVRFEVGGGPGCPTVSLVELFDSTGAPVGSYLASSGEVSTLAEAHDAVRIRSVRLAGRDAWESHCPPPPAGVDPVPALFAEIGDLLGNPVDLRSPSGTEFASVRAIRAMSLNGLLPRLWHGTRGVGSVGFEGDGPPIVVAGLGSYSWGLSQGMSSSTHRMDASVAGEDPPKKRLIQACCLGSSGKDGVEGASVEDRIEVTTTMPGGDGPFTLIAPCPDEPRTVVGSDLEIEHFGAVRRRSRVEYGWKVEVGERDWPGSGVRGAPPADPGFVYAIAFDQGTPGFAAVTAEIEGTDHIDRVLVLVFDENGVTLGEQHDVPLGEVATLVAPPGGSIEWPGLVGVEAKVLPAVNGGRSSSTRYESYSVFDPDLGGLPTVVLPNGVSVPGAATLVICAISAAPTLEYRLDSVTVGIGGEGDGRTGFSIHQVEPVYSQPPTCPADLAPPFGVLDLADINAFVAGFVTQNPIADLAPPFGVLDLADINAFIASFVGGCP